jgi:hypothetical protein
MDAKTVATELMPAVNTYLLAKAFAQLEREKVDKIQRAILNAASYYTSPEFLVDKEKISRITEPKDSWLMSTEDYRIYAAGVRRELEKEGYQINQPEDATEYWDYFCPALCAESLETDAAHAVVDMAGERLAPDIKDFRTSLLCQSLDSYHKFLDLAVKLTINSPGYVPPTVAGRKLSHA